MALPRMLARRMCYLVGVVCNGGHAPWRRGRKRESNRLIDWGRLEKRTPPMASMTRTQAETQKWEATHHEQRSPRSNGGMSAAGARGPLLYCSDYRCSNRAIPVHSIWKVENLGDRPRRR